MSNNKRHVGRLKSTDQRIAVVMPILPDNQDHALIIQTETLNTHDYDMITGLIDSDKGQQAQTLADAMHSKFDVSTQQTMLQYFHSRGLMRSEKHSNIMMYPQNNNPISLVDVVKAMNKTQEKELNVPLTIDELKANYEELQKRADVAKARYLEAVEMSKPVAATEVPKEQASTVDTVEQPTEKPSK